MPTTDYRQPTTDQAAAVRHAVYDALLNLLPIASYDQARTFAGNLSLCRAAGAERDKAACERMINAALMRFVNMRVTPDVAESAYRGHSKPAIERVLNRKFEDRLQHVAGFHRLEDSSPFRLNLPFNCAMYGYRSALGFYDGILCQPLDRLNFYFLLSSSKFGGPKAQRLQPRDQQYFTQFEEVRV